MNPTSSIDLKAADGILLANTDDARFAGEDYSAKRRTAGSAIATGATGLVDELAEHADGLSDVLEVALRTLGVFIAELVQHH